MTNPPFRGRLAALLLLGATCLTGCAAGRQFSIAMANPGTLQTVLVVGDGDPEAGPAPLAGSPTAANPVSTLGLVTATGKSTALRAQAPATLALTTSEGHPAAATPPSAVTTPAAQVVIPTSAAQAVVPTPTLQVGLTTPAQAVVPAATVSASSGAAGVQASLSAPVATTSAGLSAGSAGVALQASTPVASASVAGSSAKGLQVAVTSPASTLVLGAVALSAAPVQATLAGVSSAVSLAAPSPGATHPLASTLKSLTNAPLKKLKHG